jgi:DNA invertase Pin-like site-specific DNA recombinase
MSGAIVGYVRVSTVDQNTERQLNGMELAKVFTDHASGKDTKRPALTECLEYLRDGDTLVVHSMDRLGRSVLDLRKMVADLTGRGVTVRFVKDNLEFAPEGASPFSTLMLNLLGSIAEFERDLMLERQREGIAIAKGKGVYKGRKPALAPAQVVEVAGRLAAGESATKLAAEFGVSRATVYNTRGQAA